MPKRAKGCKRAIKFYVRCTAPHYEHRALATSRVASISFKVCFNSAVGTAVTRRRATEESMTQRDQHAFGDLVDHFR